MNETKKGQATTGPKTVIKITTVEDVLGLHGLKGERDEHGTMVFDLTKGFPDDPKARD